MRLPFFRVNNEHVIVKEDKNTYKLLNIKLNNHDFNGFLDSLKYGVVVTPNVDHLITLQKDEEFYRCYKQAEHIVCDSRILMIVSKYLTPKNPIKAQIAGSDLFPAFCEKHKNNNETKVFLLGGTSESVVVAKDNINGRTQSNIIVDCYSPPFGFEKSEQETKYIIDKINQSKANTLAIGVGSPKQEKWIFYNKDKLPNVKLYFAIGATIEFESGNLSRAPRWMTINGLEWLYRLGQEPKRMFKRYFIDDMQIVLLLLKQRLGIYKNPWK